MDPKSNSGQPLDPKLQETYDRVMGVSLSGGATPSDTTTPTTPTPTTPTPTPTQPDPTTPASPSDTTTPTTPSPISTPEPTMPSTDTPTMPSNEPTVPTPSSPAEPTMPTPSVSEPLGGIPSMPTPSMPEPAAPAAPTMPASPTMPMAPDQSPSPTAPTFMSDTPSIAPAPQDTKMESLQATASLPKTDGHTADTITIGLGGSPVAAGTKTQHKGISPVILIVAAVSFLLAYGVFWVKFFNYSLPFLPK